jgi:hypothetical protein
MSDACCGAHPVTFELTLPAGVTFADVLAGVDEFAVTGAVPGFFFTDALGPDGAHMLEVA